MAFVPAAIVTAVAVSALTKTPLLRVAAKAPALAIAAAAAVSLLLRGLGAPQLPASWAAAAAEFGLSALVFASAAQLRLSRLPRVCPSAFRLVVGAGPLYVIVCALCAFVLLPQLSLPSALLIGAVLMLNGAAVDRRAVTAAPAPAEVKSAVRIESAAAIVFAAPLALLAAAFAVAPAPYDPRLEPLLLESLSLVQGFAAGGFAGYFAAKFRPRSASLSEFHWALGAALFSYLFAVAVGAEPVVAAGAAGLLWSEEAKNAAATRIRLARFVERIAAPAAFLLFGFCLAPRALSGDMLTLLFALAAVTVLRVGPRLAALRDSAMPEEHRMFLAWFGGAPGAASALFLVSLLDDAMLLDHDAMLGVGALAVLAGVFAARLSSRPLAAAFVRRTALKRRFAPSTPP
jgi:NhaP-type Na+/H+ or K+/H+ antiporter